jgi:hypothetical protein
LQLRTAAQGSEMHIGGDGRRPWLNCDDELAVREGDVGYDGEGWARVCLVVEIRKEVMVVM